MPARSARFSPLDPRDGAIRLDRKLFRQLFAAADGAVRVGVGMMLQRTVSARVEVLVQPTHAEWGATLAAAIRAREAPDVAE